MLRRHLGPSVLLGLILTLFAMTACGSGSPDRRPADPLAPTPSTAATGISPAGRTGCSKKSPAPVPAGGPSPPGSISGRIRPCFLPASLVPLRSFD